MEDNQYKQLKAEFMKKYANVPRPLRSEIIVVLQEKDETLSWRTVKQELEMNTDKAVEILTKLKFIGVI